MTERNKALMDAVTIAQTLLRAEKGEGVDLTPALISEKVDMAVMILASSYPGGIDREAVIAELIVRYSRWIGKDSTLNDPKGHVRWLDAARKTNWRYWHRYQDFLERKLSIDVVAALDKTTDDILGLLEDPRREGAWDRRGLVVGHVQSGKTGNYSGLICKAADAGYKVIIVLAGMHNNLRSQTQIRLEESFLGYETSANRDPGKPIGVGEFDSDARIAPHCATARADNGDFNETIGRRFSGISPEERPWLFVVKKNKTVLTQLLRWIRGRVADGTDAETKRPIVTNLPVLVIDDEADHASVDTGEQLFTAAGEPDSEHEPKTINRLIRQILHAFDKSAYVGYTATPFANIFIHRRGTTLDEGPDLFPQAFIKNIAAPDNYVGPARIFGLRTPAGRVGGLPLIRQAFDSSDPNHAVWWMPLKHNKDHVPLYQGQSVLPPSLREAICSFVLACAARVCRGQGSEHSSMLVHVTRFTNVQRLVHEQVEQTVRRMKQRLTRQVDHEALLAELEQLWELDFEPTSRQVTLLVSGERDPGMPSWQAILAVLPEVLADIDVRIVNGTAKDALDYAESAEKGLKVIAIGGDKLARGLTLEGLCTSYFVRTTKMYDTLMQMGRWFGYRPGYVDLCRLYTTTELVEWFGHIADASEELREEFDIMAERAATPSDYGLRVQSHSVLLVTSPLKMRSAKTLQLSFSGDLLETVSFFRDNAVLDRNLAAANRLFESMGAPAEPGPINRARAGKNQRWEGCLWEGIPAETIASFMDSYATHPKAHRVNSTLIAQFIRSMANAGELTSWTVALLAGGEGSAHVFAGGVAVEGMLQRRGDATIGDRYSIGRLLSPRDEAIDLDSPSWEAALEYSVRSWKPDPARRRAGSEQTPPEIPGGKSIRHIRGLGASGRQRGLLMLCPLDPKLAGDGLFTDRVDPIMGFGISFPDSDAGVKVDYTVDHLRWEQEYGAAD